MRRHLGLKSYSHPSMKTEYQEKFLPPRGHTAPVLGSKNKHPYQLLRAMRTNNKDDNGMMTGTNNRVMSARDNKERALEMPSFRSFYMDHKWIDHPSKLPTLTNSCPRRCCCAHVCPLCSKDDNLTVYRRDYQAWKLSKRQPYKHHDNLKVYQGIGVADADGKERQLIEPTTSYKASYIPHPVQPRQRHNNSVTQTSHLQLGQPTCCGHCMPDPCNGLVHHFKTWTLETKFPSPGKDKYDPNRYLSTTHADYTPHKLPRTKPVMQPSQDQGRSKAPFEGTTTMKDDYREWDLPRRQSTNSHKGSKKDWKKGFDHCARCHGNHKHLDNTAAMSQGPVENGTVGFERVATGASGYLTGSMDGRATWMKCELHKGRGAAHQMVSGMVSVQN